MPLSSFPLSQEKFWVGFFLNHKYLVFTDLYFLTIGELKQTNKQSKKTQQLCQRLQVACYKPIHIASTLYPAKAGTNHCSPLSILIHELLSQTYLSSLQSLQDLNQSHQSVQSQGQVCRFSSLPGTPWSLCHYALLYRCPERFMKIESAFIFSLPLKPMAREQLGKLEKIMSCCRRNPIHTWDRLQEF